MCLKRGESLKSKTVFIATTIALCLIVVGQCFYLYQQHSALEILRSEYSFLQEDYNALEQRYTSLELEHSSLTSDYSTLRSEHDALVSKYGSFVSKADFDTLKSDYDKLKMDFDKLGEDLKEALEEIENLRSIKSRIQKLGVLNKTCIIIDTGVAPESIIAILYLLKHPNVSVCAVTISCGETHVEIGARNMLMLLDYLGFSDIPVAAGKSTPLQVNHTFPNIWRDWSDSFFNLKYVYLPPTDLEPSSMDASELITFIARSSTKKITLLTIGPLTNIAIALQSDPSIKDKIEEIFIMGGAVRVSGNLKDGYMDPSLCRNNKAEWNIWIDPHAAEIVFESGIPITLIPLDATNKVPVTNEFYERLGEVKHTPEAKIAFNILNPNSPNFISNFWDSLAAVTLTDQSIVSLEEHHIEVVTTNGFENIGWTKSIQGEPANAKVAVDANAFEFENLLLEVVNST